MLTNRFMPSCTVIPVAPYPDLEQAIGWLCDAFGFTLRLRIGNHRAQMNVGDGAVVLTQSLAADGRLSHSIMVRVEDVDLHYARAAVYGAAVLCPPADYPYGERQYTVADCAGNCWTFSQTLEDVAPEEWGGTAGAPRRRATSGVNR